MDIALIIMGIIIAALVIALAFLAGRRRHGAADGPDSMQLLSQQMNNLSTRLDERLGTTAREISEGMHRQLDTSVRAIGDLTRQINDVSVTNQKIVDFTVEMKQLQDILKNPKQRGILGEYYLESTLKNVLPPKNYQMQYKFDNGTIVDAVVFVGKKIIPIDSKFSLENYNRIQKATNPTDRERLEKLFKNDLKTRIDETSKYVGIHPDTMDFAFMFIPHEAIYYDLLVNEVGAMKTNTRDLIEYAFSKHVLIVSPTSFLAFLQTVLQGLRSLQIEESAKDIQKHVTALTKHLSAYDEFHQKLGRQLGTVVNHYNASSKEFGKITKDVGKITGDEVLAISSDVVDAPES